MRRIAIDCLKCGHTATIAETELETLGFRPDISLVHVTRKLVCSRCRSRAVRAYRYIDDDVQPVFPLPPDHPRES